jgi:hypothetical protein
VVRLTGTETDNTGDFDHDGNADLLWRQTSTGQVWIWRMNGTGLAPTNPFVLVATSPAGTDWQIVGTGDFDHDGNVDLLWRQSSTGQVWIWRMNGTGLASTNPFLQLPTSPAGTDWQIVGTGDFDRDGNVDLLWRQTSTGQVWIWRMNGTGLASTNPFVLVTTSPKSLSTFLLRLSRGSVARLVVSDDLRRELDRTRPSPPAQQAIGSTDLRGRSESRPRQKSRKCPAVRRWAKKRPKWPRKRAKAGPSSAICCSVIRLPPGYRRES